MTARAVACESAHRVSNRFRALMQTRTCALRVFPEKEPIPLSHARRDETAPFLIEEKTRHQRARQSRRSEHGVDRHADAEIEGPVVEDGCAEEERGQEGVDAPGDHARSQAPRAEVELPAGERQERATGVRSEKGRRVSAVSQAVLLRQHPPDTSA